jgi:phage gp46-like protein
MGMMPPMTATGSIFQIMMRYSQAVGACDVVVTPTENGRGRIAMDTTPATALLIAMGTDRRAEPDDTLPGEVPGVPAPTAGRMVRRGWVGDILLAQGQRLGSRIWLLERAKHDEHTRALAASYTAEAVAAVADYHAMTVNTGAIWDNNSRLRVTAQVGDVVVGSPVGMV